MGEKSVYVLSNGCHESFLDAAMLECYLGGQSSFVLVKDVLKADIILLLGCSVMQCKEDQTRELIRILEQLKKPGAKLVVAGCISKVIPELARPPEDCLSLAKKVDNLLNMKDCDDNIIPHAPYRPYRGGRKDILNEAVQRLKQRQLLDSLPRVKGMFGIGATRLNAVAIRMLIRYNSFVQKRIDVWTDRTYTIKISTGCCGNCSYCSIKQARGQIYSRPIQEIVGDFEKGMAQGYVDFALIGTDIGDYGKDRKENLLDLLRALVKLEGSFKIRLRNVNPRWLIPSAPQLCELLATHKFSYIQSPIQSASNNILKLMNRGYEAEPMLEAVSNIRRACPDLFIKTQIIVGFPGETDEDFRKNEALYKSKLFNYIDAFCYTDRPNTPATAFADHLSAEVIAARQRKLLAKSLFSMAPRQLLRSWLPSRSRLRNSRLPASLRMSPDRGRIDKPDVAEPGC